jgi:hypothetical protein
VQQLGKRNWRIVNRAVGPDVAVSTFFRDSNSDFFFMHVETDKARMGRDLFLGWKCSVG